MRANIGKVDLLPAVVNCCGIVDRKPAVPILSNICLEFAENSIILRSTDLDHGVISTVKANVETFGIAAVSAQTFLDVIKKSPDQSTIYINLADQGRKVVINAGKSKFELATANVSEFPKIIPLESETNFQLDVSSVAHLIDRTKFAISTDETRHVLNGMYLHKEKNKIKVAATDAHRLAVTEINVDFETDFSPLILSRKTIFELRKLIDMNNDNVNITITNSQIMFSMKNVKLIARLVEGTFPEYSRVIPDAHPYSFLVNRKRFIEAIDRVSVTSDDKSRAVKLYAQNNVLRISSANSNISSGDDEIDIEYSYELWTAGFNPRYILDVAECLDSSEELKLVIKDTISPLLITSNSESESLFVIMPMRI